MSGRPKLAAAASGRVYPAAWCGCFRMTRVIREELETDRVGCGKLDLCHPKWPLSIDSNAGEAPPGIGCLFQSMMNLPLSPGLNRPTAVVKNQAW